jgi:hypothetical protein
MKTRQTGTIRSSTKRTQLLMAIAGVVIAIICSLTLARDMKLVHDAPQQPRLTLTVSRAAVNHVEKIFSHSVHSLLFVTR